MAQISVASEHAESAGAAPAAPIALSSLALTTFFLGAYKADLFSTTTIIGLVLLFGGLVQLIVGIRSSNAAHAATFAVHGGFWLTFGAMLQLLHPASVSIGGGELGFFFLAWTVFSGIVSLSTLRANFAHVATYGLVFLAFLGLTIGAFMGNGSALTTIGGWIGIVAGVVGAYTALAHLGSPFALPTGEH